MKLLFGKIVAFFERREPVGYPLAHRIISTGEIPGVVGVKTFHAATGAADPVGRAWPSVVSREGGIAFLGVAAMGLVNRT
jgi:hypothetical protein